MEAIGSSSCGYQAAPPGRCFPNYSRRPLFRPSTAVVMAVAEPRGNRMFVFGTGFVGSYVADRLKREGWEVSGTCRSANKKRELEKMGLDAFLFDVDKNELGNLPSLQDVTHLLISVPPIAGSDDPLLCLHDLQSSIRCGNLQWLGYLSSTSVYGDCSGAWVNENYPVNPKSESAKSRFRAEKGWLDLGCQLGLTVNIFRLGGIYGPGRSALDTIIKQKSMSKEQKKRESRLYTARVHVADIYQVIKASLNSTYSGGIYNIVDDDPAPREEVFAYARALIEERWPGMINELPGDVIDLKSKKRNLSGEKRVSNARLKNELGVRLLYPTYRSGLRSILDSWKCRPNGP